LLAGSASEFIFRISACVARDAGGRGKAVHLPLHAYGDYAQAAHAWGLPVAAKLDDAQLVWTCEPSSPLGQAQPDWPTVLTRQVVVLDCAYAPLRLSGEPSLNVIQCNQIWQLFTPNKALGLTGVRAAYVIAPCAMNTGSRRYIDAKLSTLSQLSPSWPVGAHGVAMLQAWVQPEVQAWLAACVPVLRGWKARQIAMLGDLGWQVQPSEANFFCAKPPQPFDLAALRAAYGIKLRDATSFGLPGWVRFGVLPPGSQEALKQSLRVRELLASTLENHQ
jgi:histidinol-phosphate aminotransferase